jgi:hypothetical protein
MKGFKPQRINNYCRQLIASCPAQRKKNKMAYDTFNILTSNAVPPPIENVDTDQIIPARFL